MKSAHIANKDIKKNSQILKKSIRKQKLHQKHITNVNEDIKTFEKIDEIVIGLKLPKVNSCLDILKRMRNSWLAQQEQILLNLDQKYEILFKNLMGAIDENLQKKDDKLEKITCFDEIGETENLRNLKDDNMSNLSEILDEINEDNKKRYIFSGSSSSTYN